MTPNHITSSTKPAGCEFAILKRCWRRKTTECLRCWEDLQHWFLRFECLGCRPVDFQHWFLRFLWGSLTFCFSTGDFIMWTSRLRIFGIPQNFVWFFQNEKFRYWSDLNDILTTLDIVFICINSALNIQHQSDHLSSWICIRDHFWQRDRRT